MSEKIAIFGGSFNPIHSGHIKIALYAKKECDLSRVIFLPNSAPPHKDNKNMADAVHRFNMVSLAIKGYDGFEISDYEMNRTKPSYTIDTMRHMKKIYKDAELYFIIGADSLYTLNLWRNYSELIKECRFIVADRNCEQGSDLMNAVRQVEASGGSVTVIGMPKTDVTSTMIRKTISKGESLDSFLSPEVTEYIGKYNLYKSSPEDK